MALGRGSSAGVVDLSVEIVKLKGRGESPISSALRARARGEPVTFRCVSVVKDFWGIFFAPASGPQSGD